MKMPDDKKVTEGLHLEHEQDLLKVIGSHHEDLELKEKKRLEKEEKKRAKKKVAKERAAAMWGRQGESVDKKKKAKALIKWGDGERGEPFEEESLLKRRVQALGLRSPQAKGNIELGGEKGGKPGALRALLPVSQRRDNFRYLRSSIIAQYLLLPTKVIVLPNGMRVAIGSHLALNIASLGVWIDTGSRFENANINRTTHFLEHMIFKGSKRCSMRQLKEEIENIGGHFNAYTPMSRPLTIPRFLSVMFLLSLTCWPTFFKTLPLHRPN
ncbi:hypothetical protein L7F22_058880 [Adiantum nelumboides]|nr:hypothetical protein [Adiantum nelumboides]